MINCIVLDWLQLNVCVPTYFGNVDAEIVIPYKPYGGQTELFDIVKADNGTQMFRDLYHIYDKETGEEIAVLACRPHSEHIMRADTGIFKICNKYLYQANICQYVRFLLAQLELQFVNITRIDAALDFLKFDTMEAVEFINGFAESRYLKLTAAKFNATGTSWSVDKGKLTGGYESLKFGKASSDVKYYLYNKSLEMAEVKHKPWIMENWQAHGYDGTAPVWRLEFTLNSDTRGIVLDTGEVLNFKDLSMIDRIEDLYKHCFTKYFNFVHLERTRAGNVRKQSRSKPLTLFNDLYMEPVTIRLSSKKDSGRSAKTLAKNLEKLNQELRGQDFDLAIAGNELMSWIIKTRNLEAWAKKKIPDYHISERVETILAKGKQSQLTVMAQEWSSLPAIFDANGKSLAKTA